MWKKSLLHGKLNSITCKLHLNVKKILIVTSYVTPPPSNIRISWNKYALYPGQLKYITFFYIIIWPRSNPTEIYYTSSLIYWTSFHKQIHTLFDKLDHERTRANDTVFALLSAPTPISALWDLFNPLIILGTPPIVNVLFGLTWLISKYWLYKNSLSVL